MKTGSKDSSGKKKSASSGESRRSDAHPTERTAKLKGFKEGRNSSTGRFTPVEKARANPRTHQVEHVPKAGHGAQTMSKGRLMGRDSATGKFTDFLDKPRSGVFEKIPKNASSLIDQTLYKK